MMVSFVLSFFPRDVLDEILNLIESVSEDFPSYSLEYLPTIYSLNVVDFCRSQSVESEYHFLLVCPYYVVMKQLFQTSSLPLAKFKKIRTLNDGKFKTKYAESLKIYLLCLTIKTRRFK